MQVGKCSDLEKFAHCGACLILDSRLIISFLT